MLQAQIDSLKSLVSLTPESSALVSLKPERFFSQREWEQGKA